MTTIPVIDLTDALTPGSARRQEVVSQLRSAAETAGFFYVSGHGVPDSDISTLFETAKQFFELPLAEKKAVEMKEGVMRGYEGLGAQSLDQSALPDLKESFQCAHHYPSDHPYVLKKYPPYGQNQWPAKLPDLEKACMSYLERIETLARQLMELLALSLSLPDNYFEPLYNNPSDILRLLSYPALAEQSDDQNSDAARTFGAGAHTDWGAITLLTQDQIGGLEVQMPDGEWVAATPIEKTFVVNLGDIIPRWTKGRYRSNAHRVRNLHSEGLRRQSVVFFFDLDYEARIEPLPTLSGHDQTDDNQVEDSYKAFTVGEHMDEMYRRSYSLSLGGAVPSEGTVL